MASESTTVAAECGSWSMSSITPSPCGSSGQGELELRRDNSRAAAPWVDWGSIWGRLGTQTAFIQSVSRTGKMPWTCRYKRRQPPRVVPCVRDTIWGSRGGQTVGFRTERVMATLEISNNRPSPSEMPTDPYRHYRRRWGRQRSIPIKGFGSGSHRLDSITLNHVEHPHSPRYLQYRSS
jgi:hypothetical protein